MQRNTEIGLLLKGLLCLATFSLLITISMGGESPDFASFFNFIQAIDPENVLRIDWNGLLPNPCSYHWKGVKCNLEGTKIRVIKLENLSLSGKIDGKSLCKLQNLQFLSLARNRINGKIPYSILNCTSLRYLNLSSNLLNGSLPIGLSKLKNLKRLDISNNSFPPIFRVSKQEFSHLSNDSMGPSAVALDSSKHNQSVGKNSKPFMKWLTWAPLVIALLLLFIFLFVVNLRAAKLAREKEILRTLAKSPIEIPREKETEEVKRDEIRSELVFFVEEKERFKMEDLFEAEAHLRSQGLCSSLYIVQLKNNAVYAVKRIKKLNASFEDFNETMKKIGNLKHPNILPLVGMNCTNEEKLLIYGYQKNGSLLTLQENYSEGKRKFPWKLRLTLAVGIARGLNFIYQSFNNDQETIPHGKIKPSNIILDENEEPLISEYGYSKFIDPKTASQFNSNGYTAPEKSLSEQADVYSYGVILLELLTGKMVEKSGIDLPKWVKSVVREEWTGEVFDEELRKFEMFVFSLLNISLKCVAHFPENRPGISEVLEKIEDIVSAQQDFYPSPSSSKDYST